MKILWLKNSELKTVGLALKGHRVTLMANHAALLSTRNPQAGLALAA
jgi:hypothetical protein